MDNIEIIDGSYDFTRDLGQLVEIHQQDFEYIQEVIIDGEVQKLPYKVKQWILKCPRCGKIIQTWESKGIRMTDMIKYLAVNGPKYEKEIKYCVNCGQRLRFTYEIIDGSNLVTVEEVKES